MPPGNPKQTSGPQIPGFSCLHGLSFLCLPAPTKTHLQSADALLEGVGFSAEESEVAAFFFPTTYYRFNVAAACTNATITTIMVATLEQVPP